MWVGEEGIIFIEEVIMRAKVTARVVEDARGRFREYLGKRIREHF